MVLTGDFDFGYTAVITFVVGFDSICCFGDENNIFFNGGGDTFFFVEDDVVATASTEGFEGICFGDDNIFFGKDGGVEGVDTFIGQGDVVDGGTIEKPL